jgi:hypothetical protein
MPAPKSPTHIQRRIDIGFAIILSLCWVVELIHLPYLLFGEAADFNWPRVLFRTVVIGSVWAWLHWRIKPVVSRLRYLEEFLQVCSWCRRVGHDGNWLSMEAYFDSKFDTRTSHGICPDCIEQNFRPEETPKAQPEKALETSRPAGSALSS